MDSGDDIISRPGHYIRNGMEARDVIRRMMPESLTGYEAWAWGNVLKYLLRLGYKGAAAEDAAKAHMYMHWLSDSLASRDFAQKSRRTAAP